MYILIPRLRLPNRQIPTGTMPPSGLQADSARAHTLPIWALVGLISLVACDGGSSSHSNEGAIPPEEPLTGFLIDSAVSGVAYETATQHGVTGPQGDFRYERGETVRFSIGGTLLGELEGQESISTLDLAHSEALTGFASIMQVLNRRHHPFHTAINIAVLLQSLDDDGDPGNGIQITPQVAELLQGVDLDVDQRWDAFRSQLPLRHAVMQANSLGLFSRLHGVVSQASALKHLYANLEIDPEIYAVTLEEEDRNGDGTVDRTFSARHDENGNFVWLTQDRSFRAIFGHPPRIFRLCYDDSGRPVSVERDDGADGTVDVTSTLQYDVYGNLTRWSDVYSTILDDGMHPTYVTTYQYDADGTLTQEQSSAEHFHWIATSQYDANGNLTRLEYDEDGDGVPELVHSSPHFYHYSPEGRLLRHDFDEDGDGTVDRSEVYTYDTDGNLISRETRNGFDYDGDGTPDARKSIEFYEYDPQGKLTRVLVDSNGDGRPDSIAQYDANGNVTRGERDPDGDGILNEIHSYTYDAKENLIREEKDATGDGIMIEIQSYSYDDRGVRTEAISGLDEDGDGILDSVTYKATYDANGWIIRSEFFPDQSLSLYNREFEPTGWGYIFAHFLQLCTSKNSDWSLELCLIPR